MYPHRANAENENLKSSVMPTEVPQPAGGGPHGVTKRNKITHDYISLMW